MSQLIGESYDQTTRPSDRGLVRIGEYGKGKE